MPNVGRMVYEEVICEISPGLCRLDIRAPRMLRLHSSLQAGRLVSWMNA